MQSIKMFEGNKVEVLELDGEAYFNPYDVGACLGLARSSVLNHIASMNDKQVKLLKNSNIRKKDIRKLHNTGEKFLTESGVYKLAFRSTKPNAEKFSDWVTDEVLPAIRKTGRYQASKAPTTAVVNVWSQIDNEMQRQLKEAKRSATAIITLIGMYDSHHAEREDILKASVFTAMGLLSKLQELDRVRRLR